MHPKWTCSIIGYLPAGRQGAPERKMYYVYVIKSEIDGRHYKGLTENPENRLKEHNSGKTKSTRPYKPWVLVLIEEFDNLEEAKKREKYFKSGIGREYLKRLMDL